jgi:hypothetical protein
LHRLDYRCGRGVGRVDERSLGQDLDRIRLLADLELDVLVC